MSKLDELLSYDPMARAEEIVGSRYLDDTELGLAVLLSIQNRSDRDAALMEADDTVFSNKLNRYQSIIEAHGFEKVLEDDFTGREGSDKFFIYAHPSGLLLGFDTYYNSTHVNGGSLYYNLDMKGRLDPNRMDCREALIYNIRKLASKGQLITPWKERPFLWLCSYGDSDKPGYDYRTITEERISRLPQWVKDFIGSEK